MPNKVAFKYLNFKKNANPNAHVRMLNYIVKTNAKTSKEYIINAFNYMLRNTTLNWCHNYMSKKFNCIFSEFT
jgi:hypothetical protein